MQELIIIYISILFFSIFNCNPNLTDNFEIYMIENVEKKKYIELNEIQLPKEPIIRLEDIKKYDWKHHILYFKKNMWLKIKNTIFRDDNKLYYFVISINRKPIYYAMPWTFYYSKMPPSAVIYAENIEEDVFKIDFDIPGKDPRNNEEIYKILKKENKLTE